MNRGDVVLVQDQHGDWFECESLWSGTRGEPGLLARWPTRSSLVEAERTQPAKARKGMTPTPPAPPTPRV